MIKLEWIFWLCAAFFLVVAVIRFSDRGDRKRFGSGAFWAILAFTFVYGTFVVSGSGSAFVEGVGVLALAALAGTGFPGRSTERTTTSEQRQALADRFGNRLFVPALLIPLVAVVFAAGFSKVSIGGRLLLEKDAGTIIGLGVAAVVALAV